MPAVTLTYTDLTAFASDIDPAKAEIMIEDALALAAEVAPCILDPGFTKAAAAKAIIRGAVLRWNDSGSGAVTQVSAGSFQQTVDTRTARRSMFWPSEITELQKLCGAARSGRAFSIDTTPAEPELNPLFGALVNGPDGWAPGEVL
ncbi:hypothetical protein MWT96_20280 [Prescottella equi]|uniref:hypothetical protein n=1 Tax=Rhodococcus hoagii TaxID=43767 RepID=UPI0019E136CC|nr:hypothetical protein [Prescottella equi]MBM4496345.1 hypothetical protein [Prescottella equi]MBM4592341.1 hypothetical protein [Prescottella equi]MBM4594307.1 hypothetical protein [Prescottella equi]MBM4607740.1 hypothetical protein [Prescottella equi]MBM4643845.1 hypothetical protein [Prescottella equi]